MLNFTRLTIVNDSEKNVVAYADKGLLKADGTKGGKFVIKYGDTLYQDDEHCIKVVGYQPYSAAALAKATVDVSGCSDTTKVYRIAIYVRIQNNNSSVYTNKWTFKGKPLYIEFKGGTSATDIAKLAKKYSLMQYGYDLLSVTANGNNVIIEAKDQWQKFLDQDANESVVLQQLTTTVVADCIIREEWLPVANTVTINEVGTEAFGDFQHIVKDLRLPTAANLKWSGIAQGDIYGGEPNDDKPNPTGKYHQISVQYDSSRGIGQQTVLGGVGTSRTMHIFYVEDGAVTDFLTKLTTAGAANVPTKGTKAVSTAAGEEVPASEANLPFDAEHTHA